jgi:hypothetical protein
MNFEESGLDITTYIGCPVSCSYCPQGKTMRNYKGDRMMTIETLDKYLSKIPIQTNRFGEICPRIEFSGFCEPFTNPNCADLINLAYEKGFKNITLYTTLRGMRLDDFEKIKSVPFLFVSLHLPDINGFTNIPVNDEYFELMGKILETYDVGFFAYGTIRADVIDFIKIKLPKALTGGCKWDVNIHSRAGNVDMVKPVERKTGHIQCYKSPYMELNNNVLLPNGDVSVCCMDFDLQHIVGNLLTDEYTDLFQSEEHNKVVAGMFVEEMNSMCRICDFAVPNTRN